MRSLLDIVTESLLDDEDEIMGKAYDKLTNPFLIIARTPKDICVDNEEFAKVLRTAEELIRKESKVVDDFKKTKQAKYKISFNFEEPNGTVPRTLPRIALPPRMYVKYGRNTYVIQGKSFTSMYPMTAELGRQGHSHLENNPPYYIPSKKLEKQLIEFMEVAIEANKFNGDKSVWNKYIAG